MELAGCRNSSLGPGRLLEARQSDIAAGAIERGSESRVILRRRDGAEINVESDRSGAELDEAVDNPGVDVRGHGQTPIV